MRLQKGGETIKLKVKNLENIATTMPIGGGGG